MNDQINIALPKGRLGERVYAVLSEAGYGSADAEVNSRKLVFDGGGVRYFWVKPSDVPIYVERGAADLGVCGSDILLEQDPDVYELSYLHTGVCRIAVAAKKGFRDDPGRVLRVATKFENTARRYYAGIGRQVDIIKLNGSIELAPILGLSDVIVDIVETGTTLRENGLEVVEKIADVSARLIANKSSYKFKTGKIKAVQASLSAVTER